MRRLGLVLLALLAACTSAGDTTTSEMPTTAPAGPATTTMAPPEGSTTEPSAATTTTLTTTSTLAPLQALAYEEVARLPWPMEMVPWIEGLEMIATKDGRVWLYDGAGVSEQPVLDIRDRVRDSGEQGLLSIAVHPDDTERVFLHYSAANGDTVVSEFSWDNGSLVDEQVLFRLGQPARNHNGGMIQFGPDDRLYLGLGDGGGANDRFNNGQNTDTLLGGLVAIDVDDPDVEPVLFNHGLRNPWRFWIDGETVYVADVGQGRYEEVSVVPFQAGVNFGWPILEGAHCFQPSSGCDTDGLVIPVVEIPHGDAGTCSIAGGILYRGDLLPELAGHYFFSDYCGGYLRGLGPDTEVTDYTSQVGVAGRVIGFGVDGAGEMYVMTTEEILKVVAVRG